MTTIHHPPAPRRTSPLALVSALALALAVMVTLAVLAAASDDPPTSSGVLPTVEREPATGGSGGTSILGDWDVLCFKPAYRDAPPCLRRTAPDRVTRGRIP